MIIYSQKYYNKYNQIIKHYKDLNLKKSKSFDTESHHILPKSMGGSDKKDNLVRIPARVHFLLHWMLYRIYKTKEMSYAWNMMCTNPANGNRYTSKSYQYARKIFGYYTSIRQTGNPLSDSHKASISISNKGKIFSADHKKKISISKIGKTHSVKSRLNMSESKKGKLHTEETKKKMSLSRKGTKCSIEAKHNMSLAQAAKPKLICPHCSKSGYFRIMKRWHFDNCKQKVSL